MKTMEQVHNEMWGMPEAELRQLAESFSSLKSFVAQMIGNGRDQMLMGMTEEARQALNMAAWAFDEYFVFADGGGR